MYYIDWFFTNCTVYRTISESPHFEKVQTGKNDDENHTTASFELLHKLL